MPKIRTKMVLAAILGLAATMPAVALLNETFVSSTGGGTACTRASPCFNFSAAQSAVNAGGVVTYLDSFSGGGNTIAITKALTVRTESPAGGIASSAPSIGPWFTVAAGANDVVTLIGLNLNAGGITFNSGQHLHVIGCRITNNNLADETGIRFAPNGSARLSVSDTIITNYGSGTGGGIVVNPRSGGSARVDLERVSVKGNAFGIAVDGSNSTAGINLTLTDSVSSGNSQDALVVTTSPGGSPIGVAVKNSRLLNSAYGIRSIGSGVTVRVDGSTIVGNGTGLAAASGGALLSTGTNLVQANGSNGAFSGSVALQ